MAKYNEIMEKITVTPEMRERVLLNVHNARTAGSASHRRSQKIALFKILPIAAAACLVLVIGVTALKKNSYSPSETPSETAEGSIEEFATLDELSESVNFDVEEIQDIPFEVESTAYSNVFGLARIDYTGVNGETLTFSKGVDDGTDVSGDNNEYEHVETIDVNGMDITVKGNGSSYNLATWTNSGYAYAININPGISKKEITEIIGAF